jgi:hypothetical protein
MPLVTSKARRSGSRLSGFGVLGVDSESGDSAGFCDNADPLMMHRLLPDAQRRSIVT